MTQSEADVLLAQWAMWAFNDVRAGYARGSWQNDWRTIDWDDDEHKSRDIVIDSAAGGLCAGDDKEMELVDRALAQLGRTDAHNAHILRARYRLGHNFTFQQMRHALNQFIYVWEGLTATRRHLRA